jgi:hypothetical protein
MLSGTAVMSGWCPAENSGPRESNQFLASPRIAIDQASRIDANGRLAIVTDIALIPQTK